MEKPLAVGALFTKRKNREIAENYYAQLFDYLPKADRMGRKTARAAGTKTTGIPKTKRQRNA